MDEPFFTSARSDALRWLAMADRQLEVRDLHGSRSFALSSRKAKPSLDADRILAIADTLLAAERRCFVNNQPNWLAVFNLTPPEGLDPVLISERFRRLRNLLHPRTNKHPYAEQAFDLIHQAYANLIPPPGLTPPINAPMPAALPRSVNLVGGGSRVAQQQIVQVGQSSGGGRKSWQKHNCKGLFWSPNFEIGSSSSRPGLHNFINVRAKVHATVNLDVELVDNQKEEERASSPVAGDGSTFWTACPYCYYMYEYPQVYINCAMRCQKCKRAFHAVVIASPPPIVVVDGKESYHFSWPRES